MWPLCPRWSAMQSTNGTPRPPAHPSLRYSRDTPEESLPWLPALSSSPRNPRTLVPSVSLAGSRQAPTRAQAPPSGRGEVAWAGVGRWEPCAGRKCSWAFPRGRLPAQRSPGAQIRPGPHHLHSLGSVGNRICCTFSWRRGGAVRSGPLTWDPPWDFPGRTRRSSLSTISFQCALAWHGFSFKHAGSIRRWSGLGLFQAQRLSSLSVALLVTSNPFPCFLIPPLPRLTCMKAPVSASARVESGRHN